MPIRKRPLTVPDQGAAQNEIEAAFRELRPVVVTKQNTWLPIEYHEAMIRSFSEDLVLLMAPDRTTPPISATKEQLAKVRKHGSALWVSIESLQGPAIGALDFHKPTLGEFQLVLQRLVEAASRPIVPIMANRRGPKEKIQPRRIAAAAAEYFSRLTGKPPTRVTYPRTGKANLCRGEKAEVGGEFSHFLGRVFKALGVTASADRYSKEAIRLWTNRHQSQPK